jgi:hypothetical protein
MEVVRTFEVGTILSISSVLVYDDGFFKKCAMFIPLIFIKLENNASPYLYGYALIVDSTVFFCFISWFVSSSKVHFSVCS